MGQDSIEPFLQYPGHWAIVLALTSNPGAMDFQFNRTGDQLLFEKVVDKCQQWGTPENLMFVVGATRGELLGKIRAQAPEHFFLIPGLGAQGGSMDDIINYALTDDIGVLANVSRSIIYTSNGLDFAAGARSEAQRIQKEMSDALLSRGI
jgi:orotidine-5'-phosphate decarboxylase